MDEHHQHQHQDLYPLDNKTNIDINIDQSANDHDPNYLDNGEDVTAGIHGENNYEAGPYYCTDNNPPDSYAVCETKVSDWLDRNTFIERKASVKFACAAKNNVDPTQTRSSRRSISLNQRPKLSIIGFRKKPVNQTDGKSKHNDRVEKPGLFRNRSEPGRDYCLLITDPVSPRVSCVGRVGSVRVQGRKAGVWRSFKAAFSNLVQANNRVAKINA